MPELARQRLGGEVLEISGLEKNAGVDREMKYEAGEETSEGMLDGRIERQEMAVDASVSDTLESYAEAADPGGASAKLGSRDFADDLMD